MKTSEMVKLTFPLEPDGLHGIVSETLWAERVGTNRFRLANTPFYVPDVSYRDIVFARRDRHGQLAFAGVSLRGGHSTCWMALREDVNAAGFRSAWAKLQNLGCGYEGDSGRFLAVDVPPGADFCAVRDLLEAGAAEGTWEYGVAHCGHPVHAREPVAEWLGGSWDAGAPPGTHPAQARVRWRDAGGLLARTPS